MNIPLTPCAVVQWQMLLSIGAVCNLRPEFEFCCPLSYRGMIWQHLKTGHDRFLSHSCQIVFTTWTHKSRATVFCTVAPNMFGPSLWNMLHVTLPASIILRWLLDFRKVCRLLIFIDIIIYYFLLYFWYSVLKCMTQQPGNLNGLLGFFVLKQCYLVNKILLPKNTPDIEL
jgi:hypothetical protein